MFSFDTTFNIVVHTQINFVIISGVNLKYRDIMDNGTLEHRYRALRKRLDDLGYLQPLVVESLPLVEKLVLDLLHTTESLRHYKELAQKSLEVCQSFTTGYNLLLLCRPVILSPHEIIHNITDVIILIL
jgi:hypothetical protein